MLTGSEVAYVIDISVVQYYRPRTVCHIAIILRGFRGIWIIAHLSQLLHALECHSTHS